MQVRSVAAAVVERVWLAAIISCLSLLVSQGSTAGERYAVAGIGGGPDNLHAYQGVIWTPLSELSQSGPVVRIWSKSYRFFYSTNLPGRGTTQIAATGAGVEAEAGYQLAGTHARVAVLAGVAWRDHVLIPADPFSSLEEARFGFSATIDGSLSLTRTMGVMGNASYLTGFNQYWTQLQPYWQAPGGWKIGPQITAAGGLDYSYGRGGLFLSGFEIELPAIGKTYLGAEAGIQMDFSGNRIEPFAGINAGFMF